MWAAELSDFHLGHFFGLSGGLVFEAMAGTTRHEKNQSVQVNDGEEQP